MNELEYKELEQYALQCGFKIKEQKLGFPKPYSISFYPMECIDLEENVYLTIIFSDLKITRHKFLSPEEFSALPGVTVSLNWVKNFLEFRSGLAEKDNQKALIQFENNQKLIHENEQNQSPDAEDNLDRIRQMTEDKPGYQASYKNPTSLDDYDEMGPESDDWDSESWEKYMGGPD